MKAKWIIILAVAIPVVAASSTLSVLKFGEKPAEYRTAIIERGDITSIVMASGTLHPLLTVQVGSQVSGTIKELYADADSEVAQGQLIAKIDPAPFISKVNEVKANLKMTEAKVASASAEVVSAEVQVKDTKRTYDRFEALVKDGVVTREDRDVTLTKYETALAGLDSAKAQYELALAELEQARAELVTAELDLGYTDIFSPVDGTVLTRVVDVGQTVSARMQTPILFTIAQDLREMEAHLDVNEADIGRLTVGQSATFYVNAYPGQTFGAEVVNIRSSPKVTQNVVTYDVVIGVNNGDLRLKPGMTANATIVVAEAKDVIKIPNAALRFRPPLPEKDNREKSGDALKRNNKNEGSVVYVLAKKGKIDPVPVEIGVSDNNFTELVKGDLKVGELVAVGLSSKGKSFDMPSRRLL
ncbi:MAG TPA: efflux RND transporter periplasmic adaptor subunit [Candidatus Avalokitesvara rifleensis]|uniref:efflux RND transporter periplasmic adaptor subunit n=1 Tax=Candidatus Avalokitesvara rifleensis TaxID=3367620 RepID=UPI0027126B7A|nr:efflux RND transporter periplasmic adaptor subunit [Candidatus Brocadiales bacterium]